MISRVYTADFPIHGTGGLLVGPRLARRGRPEDRRLPRRDRRRPARPRRGASSSAIATTRPGGMAVLMRPPERSINHSCDPNTYIRTIAGDRYVVALRAIRPGEEVTFDYCVNGDGDTAWDCSCGSPACRRRHRSGFFHLPEEVQARYLALLEDWSVAQHREGVEILKRRVEEELR